MKNFKKTGIFLCAVFMFFSCTKVSKQENSSSKNNEQSQIEKDDSVKKQFEKSQKEEERQQKKLASRKKVDFAFAKDETAVFAAYLMESAREISGKTDAFYEIFLSYDEIIPELVSGQIDFAVLPVNKAAETYKKNAGAIKIAAVVQNCSSVFVSEEDFTSVLDLSGKKISVCEENSLSDLTLKYFLKQNDLKIGEGEEEVFLEYNADQKKMALDLADKKISCALLDEPYASFAVKKNPNLKKSLSLEENLPFYVLVVNSEFASKNKGTVKKVLKIFKNSKDWIFNNPIKAGIFFEKRELGFEQKIITASIADSNLTFLSEKNLQSKIEEILNILIEMNPEFLESSLPDKDFYL